MNVSKKKVPALLEKLGSYLQDFFPSLATKKLLFAGTLELKKVPYNLLEIQIFNG